MLNPYGKVKTVISLASIVNNYKFICEASGKEVVPVIKGDAYGHGLIEVAGALAKAGATTFAVGTVDEGVMLRSHLPGCSILSMLGPVEDHEYPALWESDIIGFIHCFEQLDKLAEHAPFLASDLRVALKFDTGMRRLGFNKRDVPAIVERLKAMGDRIKVSMISSNLATADDPQSKGYLKKQVKEFESIQAALLERGLTFEANLSNSAATLAYPDIGYRQQRVGIILYGVNPLWGTDLEHLCGNLEPAMSVKSVVISIHSLRAGQTISYGCTFKANRDMTVAIVAAGYGNGYSRSLSNSGEMCIHGKRAKIVGRVCLQMAAVDITGIPGVKVGNEVFLLGGDGAGSISIYELSKWWKSIPAEVMNSLSVNKREFVDA